MKIAVVIVLALVGCQSKPDAGASAGAGAGKERGPCYGNGTCDQGLVCLSQLCVAPPAADCAAIADHLGGLLLGNYAPRDERDAFIATAARDCTAAKLTRDAGDCLLRAESRQAIGACPTPLGVGDCTKIVPHLQAMLPKTGTDQWLVTGADRLIARCKNEVPSQRLEQCVLAAKTIEQVEPCTW